LREPGTEIATLHGVERIERQARLVEIEVVGGERRAERAAGVACGRLHPNALAWAVPPPGVQVNAFHPLASSGLKQLRSVPI
jgi:hypothetical protein